MKMYLLPIEIFIMLYFLIPLGVIAYQWKQDTSWWKLTIAASVLSWLFFNASMRIDPPDNGFANAVYYVSGWFWMLPLLGLLYIFSLGFNLVFKNFSNSTLRKDIGKYGFRVFSVLSTFCVLWGVFGQMNSERAIAEARKQLKKYNYTISGREYAVFEDGHWIVKYPDTDFKEIGLQRNGSISWIGGPG
jgi:hypothetical protein